MEEASGPRPDVWAINLPVVNLFIAMDTQWRVGPGGRTGLDYGALPGVMRVLGVKRADWGEIFQLLRVMEEAALIEMHGNG